MNKNFVFDVPESVAPAQHPWEFRSTYMGWKKQADNMYLNDDSPVYSSSDA